MNLRIDKRCMNIALRIDHRQTVCIHQLQRKIGRHSGQAQLGISFGDDDAVFDSLHHRRQQRSALVYLKLPEGVSINNSIDGTPRHSLELNVSRNGRLEIDRIDDRISTLGSDEHAIVCKYVAPG